MLYQILKQIVKLAIRVFYRNISVSGLQHIPAAGPMIVVANHPNTIMDPLLIAAQLNMQVYFLAKSSFFSTPFLKWLLRKLHMIPIYRAQDQKLEGRSPQETAAANQAIFAKCISFLEEGGTLLIFPEGTSILERRLRELKTGTARIALSALSEKVPEVYILPVGLNYESATDFRSDVVIKFGEPVLSSAFAADYAQKPTAGVQKLTGTLTTRIEELIINTETEEDDSLLVLLEFVYKEKLQQELGLPKSDKQASFALTREISQSIAYYKRTNPVMVRRLHLRIASYVSALKRLRLQRSYLHKPARKAPTPLGFIPGLVFLVAGFPVYLYGLLHNYVPYKIPGIAAKKLTEDEEFEAPIMLGVGMLTFPIWYGLCLIVAGQFMDWVWLALYALSLPVSGFFALYYRAAFLSQRGRWQLVALTKSRGGLIQRLQAERQQILQQLEELKNEYLLQTQSPERGVKP